MSDATTWLRYFHANSQRLLDVPWDAVVALAPDERRAITKSIAEFQRGESSEGKQLFTCAAAYAEQQHDPDFLEATLRFIKEEQRHARDLGRFMDTVGIARTRSAWPDELFRTLRHFGGIDVSTTVLVTAEIIARVLPRAPASDERCRAVAHLRANHWRRTRACAVPMRAPCRLPSIAALSAQIICRAAACNPVFRRGIGRLAVAWTCVPS